MTAHVLDAAWGWPDLAQAKKDGYVGIIGYLSDSPTKNLTTARIAQARALGMSVNVVWEDGASDFATWTTAQCSAAGAKAQAQKAALGIPAAVPVFAAVDFDAPMGSYPKIAANIAAFTAATGGHGAVYGPAPLIDYLFTHRVASYGWQAASTSWSANKVSGNACLVQTVAKTLPKIAGDYDENVVLRSDYGAWYVPKPTPPKPAEPSAHQLHVAHLRVLAAAVAAKKHALHLLHLLHLRNHPKG